MLGQSEFCKKGGCGVEINFIKFCKKPKFTKLREILILGLQDLTKININKIIDFFKQLSII